MRDDASASMTWLEGHAPYRSWVDEARSAVMAIVGDPGLGNTFLASSILRFLLASADNVVFLSFGFYRWDIRRTSERSFTVSIIRQLLAMRPDSYQRIQAGVKSWSDQTSLSLSRLWAILRVLLADMLSHSRVVLVVNGVDQCLEPVADKIALLTTIAVIKAPLKILMTSSTGLKMPSSSIAISNVPLNETAWRQTIRNIVEERVIRIVDQRPVWRDSQQVIVEKLCHGDGYTFLDVMLNLDILEQSMIPSTKDALTQQLMAPSQSTQGAYDMIVSGLLLEEAGPTKLALNWLFHAARPLTVSELSVALALSLAPDGVDLTFDILTKTVSWDIVRDLGTLLGPTVKVINNDRIMLVHHTFRDYLQSHDSLLIPRFHGFITERCLLYLAVCADYPAKVSIEQDSIEQREIREAAALLEYTAAYWSHHFKQESPAIKSLDKKVRRFLQSDTKERKMWVDTWSRAFGWERHPEGDQPLLLATQLGLERIVHGFRSEHADQIESAREIAARTGSGSVLTELLMGAEDQVRLWSALRAAAQYGHVEAIELVTAPMNDVQLRNLYSQPPAAQDDPLLGAAMNGHAAAIAVLLSQGHQMQSLDESGNTAVHLASRLGDFDTLSVMKELRPDTFQAAVTSTNNNGMTPLQLTCIAGFYDAFYLVQNSSPLGQVNRAEQDSLRPIQLAASSGCLDIVQRLIDVGVEMIEEDTGLTSLEYAAADGHYAVVRLLVDTLEKLYNVDQRDAGATPTTITGNKDKWEAALHTSLESAANKGHARMAEFLLSKMQRNPDRDQEYITLAANSGHLDILRVLTAAGIPITMSEDEYNPILDIAIRDNQVDMVRFVVDRGVRSQWDGFETSIHYAVRLGHVFCLREVLTTATEDEVLRKNDASNTPLTEAAQRGQLSSVQEILAWSVRRGYLTETTRRPPKTLLEAISSDEQSTKVELVTLLLDHGWAVDAMHGSQGPPLHVAVENNTAKEVVELLLDRGADVNACNKTKGTALRVVAAQGDAVCLARLLLEKGADPNIADKDGLTPLHVAVERGNSNLVRLLLGLNGEMPAAGLRADVERETTDGWRAIHYASKSLTMTKILLTELEPKPDVNVKTKAEGETPLVIATRDGESAEVMRVMEMLIGEGARPNEEDADGWTALHYALGRANSDDMEIIKYLLKKRADPNAQTSNRRTPLYTAIRNENDPVALFLLETARARPNVYGGVLHSPLQAAAFRGETTLCERLLDAGADPNAQGGLMGSPLHAAVWSGSLQLIQLLLDKRAHANANNPPFGTPLHALFSSDRWMPRHEITRLLLKKNAEIEALDSAGRTPLLVSIARRPDDDSETLLVLEAKPDPVDRTGATPLHYAAAGSHSLGLIQRLLDAGAKADARDGCGRSVLYHAALGCNQSRFQAILEHLPAADKKTDLAAALPAVLKQPTGLLAADQVEQVRSVFHMILNEEGIDLNTPDSSGWTALDIAECYEMIEEASVLRQRGAIKGVKQARPSSWSIADRNDNVSASDDGMEASIKGIYGNETNVRLHGAMRANHCIPMDQGIFYFEVEITHTIAVGFLQESSTMNGLVGWQCGTWGYHSDDGSVLTNDEALETGNPYGARQTVGVAFDPSEKGAWFTLDGDKVGNQRYRTVGQLYPAVSFLTESESAIARVRVNFGPEFKYQPLPTEGTERLTDSIAASVMSVDSTP